MCLGAVRMLCPAWPVAALLGAERGSLLPVPALLPALRPPCCPKCALATQQEAVKKFRAYKIQHFADGRKKNLQHDATASPGGSPCRLCVISTRTNPRGCSAAFTLLYWEGGGGGGMREGKGGILIFQIQMILP